MSTAESKLARLEAMLDALRVGIVAVDAQDRVELQNAEASRILGISQAATRGAPLERVLGRAHPAVALMREARERGRDVLAFACAIPPRFGGEPLTVNLAASPIGAGDTPEGAALALVDRSIGHELEALAAERARSELFGALAAGIAHEVRNPLGGIRGAAELLLGKLADPALRRYPELIRDETDRVRRLLDELSQLAGHGELHLRRVNLHQVLDDLLELQRQAAEWSGIEIAREYDPSLPEMELDADRLAQVFLNLMRNAVQAMAGKGRLTVRTRLEPVFHLASGDDHGSGVRLVNVDVEDTGPGLREEDLPYLFTPFFSRRPQGTGLGLAVAQHWVVRHGGRIHVASRPGEGARLRVMLPVRRSA